jgi:hypothetical protein
MWRCICGAAFRSTEAAAARIFLGSPLATIVLSSPREQDDVGRRHVRLRSHATTMRGTFTVT